MDDTPFLLNRLITNRRHYPQFITCVAIFLGNDNKPNQLRFHVVFLQQTEDIFQRSQCKIRGYMHKTFCFLFSFRAVIFFSFFLKT